jgi:hypothetical protein
MQRNATKIKIEIEKQLALIIPSVWLKQKPQDS